MSDEEGYANDGECVPHLLKLGLGASEECVRKSRPVLTPLWLRWILAVWEVTRSWFRPLPFSVATPVTLVRAHRTSDLTPPYPLPLSPLSDDNDDAGCRQDEEMVNEYQAEGDVEQARQGEEADNDVDAVVSRSSRWLALVARARRRVLHVSVLRGRR